MSDSGRTGKYDNSVPSIHPSIRGRCPSCRAESLFLGSNGYATCSVIGCKDPGAAHDLLMVKATPRNAEAPKPAGPQSVGAQNLPSSSSGPGLIQARLLAQADGYDRQAEWDDLEIVEMGGSRGGDRARSTAKLLREAADALSTPQARVEMRLLRHPWDDRPIAEVPVESYDGLTALLQALWERR